MPLVNGLVPSRFLTLTAHLVIVITIFWSRENNVRASLPLQFTQKEYERRDMELVVALSVTLGLFAVELAGFLSGVSMFNNVQSLLSIGAHTSAALVLVFFLFEQWDGSLYWWIFAFCRSVVVLLASSGGRTWKSKGPFFLTSRGGGGGQNTEARSLPAGNQLHLQAMGIKKVVELIRTSRRAHLVWLPVSRSGPPDASESAQDNKRPVSCGHSLASGIQREPMTKAVQNGERNLGGIFCPWRLGFSFPLSVYPVFLLCWRCPTQATCYTAQGLGPPEGSGCSAQPGLPGLVPWSCFLRRRPFCSGRFPDCSPQALAAHCSAAICLSFFIFERWETVTYWYILGFCSALPTAVEILLIISVFGLKKKPF